MRKEPVGGQVFHTLEPVYDASSRVLILGTMPSPKSRELGFYYAHPQNRFWDVLARLAKHEKPITNAEKLDFLLRHGIALWDVLKSCEIRGAADSSIKNPVPNDIRRLLSDTQIRAVFTTGSKAYELYNRYCLSDTGAAAIALPSTSPAHRRVSYEEILAAYSVVFRNF